MKPNNLSSLLSTYYIQIFDSIESSLYERQAIAEKISNFENRLPAPQSELAIQTMKDPYVFDFIPFKEDMIEKDTIRGYIRHN